MLKFQFRPNNQSLNFRKKTNLETKLYYKTSEGCHHMTEIHHYHRCSKSATRPAQLLISIQKYKTVHVLGQQT